MGFSESNLNNLLYDLQKLHSISDLDKIKVESNFPQNIDQTDADKVKNINVVGATIVGTEETKSLREEFPFLKNEDCPNELKILVADKITAWNMYQEAHAKLLQFEKGELVLNEAEQTELSKKSVTAFAENQAIYDELNCYKETGKMLGVHPIFKELQLQREVDEMDNEKLIAFKNASAKYFSDNKKTLAKAKLENDLEKVNEITIRVAERGKKLGLVNKKLGIKK
jgi:hypothetical protein